MLTFALAATLLARAPHTSAADLARQALAFMGGEAAIRGLRAVRLSGIRQRNALEQSTRPTGPWIPDVQDVTETRWPDAGALDDRTRSRGLSTVLSETNEWAPSRLYVSGGRAARIVDGKTLPGGGAAVQSAEETLGLGPERALLTALAAPDLHLDPDLPLNGRSHHVLAFTWRATPVRIYVDPVSSTPAAVEMTRPRSYDVYWAPWGEVTSRTDWDLWMREPGGLRYPHLWAVTSNGMPESSFVIDKVELDVADPSPATPSVPAPKPIDQLSFPAADKVLTIAPGVRLTPGAWNIMEIDRGGSTFVVEAPISAAYSRAEITRLRDSKRALAGLITTSDAWPHIGGVREYVAEGAPLYAVDLNQPILERLIHAPHRTTPDSLASGPRRADWRLVSHRTSISGAGRRIELVPFHTATGERQMAVWLPEDRLLYTSDIFQIAPDGSFSTPEAVEEVREVIARERLDVRTVVGMHYGPTPWTEVLKRSGLS